LNIFISHISEEASIAEVLKDWIESTFLGQSEVFASSDTDDLPARNKWIDEIDQALDSAVAFLVLCSPASLKRPWIHLETGWGWIKGLPIIPICHSACLLRLRSTLALLSFHGSIKMQCSTNSQLRSVLSPRVKQPSISCARLDSSKV